MHYFIKTWIRWQVSWWHRATNLRTLYPTAEASGFYGGLYKLCWEEGHSQGCQNVIELGQYWSELLE
jgi:hypothetical protein